MTPENEAIADQLRTDIRDTEDVIATVEIKLTVLKNKKDTLFVRLTNLINSDLHIEE